MKKTVVITGSTKGIGAATAIRFAKDGYNVVVSGRNEKNGHNVVKDIKSKGGEAIFIRTDVQKEAQVRSLVDKAIEKYGSLDVMVNNAGIAFDSGVPAFELSSTEAFHNLFLTNVMGVYWGMKFAALEMLKKEKGSIINVASIAGLKGIPFASQYCATKHAVIALTRSAALEYAKRGVRVNAMAPGAVDTDILKTEANRDIDLAQYLPIGRLGNVDEIANGIAYMASDDSPFMIGEVMCIDGGFNAT